VADTVRVLSVVSSWEGEGALNGFWLRELTHPYFFLAEAGVAVDIASTRGGKPAVAPLSNPRHPQTREREDLISLGFLHDDGAALKLQDTVALSDVEAGGYAAVHFVGGIGPVHDFVNNPDVKRISRSDRRGDQVRASPHRRPAGHWVLARGGQADRDDVGKARRPFLHRGLTPGYRWHIQ
jgi:hypothetical protein